MKKQKQKQNKASSPLLNLCFGLFLTILGGLLAIAGIGFSYDLYLQYDSKNWPTVNASVSSTSINQHMRHYRYEADRMVYQPEIKYSYNLPNLPKTQESSQISFMDAPSFFEEIKARQFIADHISDGTVIIHYNPGNLSDSIIVTKVSSEQIVIWFFCLFGGLTLTYVGYWMIINRRA